MTVYEKRFRFNSKGEADIINITEEIKKAVKDSGILEGIGLAFVPGATGAITAIEYEKGLLYDFSHALKRIAPKEMEYKHHLKWHDDNGRSHVKASILGPDLSFPISKGEPVLGIWQQIVFVELDTRPRERTVVLKMVGE